MFHTVGEVQFSEGYPEYSRGYHDVFQECSVQWGIILSTVGDTISVVEEGCYVQ